MRPINRYIIFILSCLAGCGPRELPETELLQYIVDPANELSTIVEKGPVKIEVNYKPADLVMARDLKDIADASAQKEAIATVDSITYFVLKLSANDHEIETMYAGDPRKFGEVLNYLSYGIANDLKIVNEGDTIDALDVVYSRAFGSASSSQLMVAFKTNLKQRAGVASLHLNDVLFGTGLTEFEFDCDRLKEIPRLKLP